jgi:hypothetical protein
VPVLQRPMLLLNVCLFYSSLCCTWTCLVYSSLCALGRVCSTAVCLSLDEGTCMWVFYSNLYSRRYLAPTPAYSSFRCTWTVPLQEPVLHLHFRLQELCAAPECFCLQEPALHLCVSVYKSFVLHLDMSTRVYAAPVRVRLAEICAAPGRVCLQERVLQLCMSANKSTAHSLPVDVQSTHFFWFVFGMFRNRHVCFGCFDTCSKNRNKSKKVFFGFVKQTEKQPKQI